MKDKIFVLKAPAKINLHLEICGRRPDGYHELETIFHPLHWLADDVKLETLDSSEDAIEVVCSHPDVPENDKNICFKAAAKFAEAAEVRPSWRITINKRIPVAAGLGGGSSDAAAVLRLLNANVAAIGDDNLRSLALGIGADVPFFLDPRPALGKGLGEILEPIDSKLDLSVLIVDPLFPVSAAWAYRNIISDSIDPAERDSAKSAVLAASRSGDPTKLPAIIANDLAPALLRKFPLLRILLDDLAAQNPLSRGVSGSGPTLFAVFADDSALRLAAAKLAEIHGDSAIRVLRKN